MSARVPAMRSNSSSKGRYRPPQHQPKQQQQQQVPSIKPCTVMTCTAAHMTRQAAAGAPAGRHPLLRATGHPLGPSYMLWLAMMCVTQQGPLT